ncbi:MAG: hypothetical protein WBQ44_16835 [Rhodococcus sp. (in: high G+C Gram-positive bacteria)]
MSIPLTLGVPDRPDPQALVAGLLHQRCRTADDVEARFVDVSSGPPVIAASRLIEIRAGISLGRIVVDLDIDPDELRAADGADYEVVRFHLTVDEDTVAEATELRLPSPLVIFPVLTSPSALETVTVIVDAHRTPGFAASASPRQIADILAVVAHSDVGFSARAETGGDVLSLLAATVAALRGDDIPTALAEPNVRAMAALRPEAAQAMRTVLFGIEVADAEACHRELVGAGLVRPLSSNGRS